MEATRRNDQGSAADVAITSSERDAGEHGQALRGWRLECLQISAGCFESRLTQLRLDHLQIIREKTNQALMKRGASWPGSVVLSLPLAASGHGWSGGRQITYPSGLLSDGHDLPEILTPIELDLVCLAVEQRWFAIQAIEFGYPDIAEHVWRQENLVIQDDQLRGLQQLFQSIFTEIQIRPSLLLHPASRQSIEETILEHLLEALSSAIAIDVWEDTPRKKTADTARILALRDASEPLDIARICRVIGVSRRHLQNCFLHSYGQTATRILRAIRLNRVRQELRDHAVSGKRVSIGDVAARWGFWHWSRFTGDYRAHFGELPSATLRFDQQHPVTEKFATVPKTDNAFEN